MKKLGLFLVSFCFSLAIFSQSAPLGKDVVNSFSVKMQNLTSLSAKFTFTLENLKEKITDTHEGDIVVKGKKYNLELMGMEAYFDGKTKWQYVKEANEVTISEPTSLDGGFMEDPTKLFKDYEKNFKSKFIGEKVEKGRFIYELELYPIDLKTPYSKLNLKFDKKTLEPVQIKYQGKDGNNYIIKVKVFRSNVPVRDERFTFEPKKHKGIEIVDMR
ncbi:MAG: outer membrane lipoprotein carrier protein LolA [Bacteroidales bacterium]|nr:MAG: outer membrane lipoprotein carrier protein LolA [Bacteroidales bacterium]